MNEQPVPRWKNLNVLIFAFGGALLLVATFQVGVFIGERKATFAYRWSENYHRIFAGPQHGFFNNFQGPMPMDAHGVFGSVLKVDGDTMLIEGKDDTEESVVVSTSTVIRHGSDTIPLNDVTTNNQVTVIGTPNDDGQIMAQFIRIFDHP